MKYSIRFRHSKPRYCTSGVYCMFGAGIPFAHLLLGSKGTRKPKLLLDFVVTTRGGVRSRLRYVAFGVVGSIVTVTHVTRTHPH